MRTGFFLAFAFMMAAALGPLNAGERGKPVALKQLPTELRMFILGALKEQGVRGNGAMTYASDATKTCPSNCNDSSGGGFCYCSPDSSGNCPSGTEKGGSPGDEYCKVSNPGKGTGIVSGGGLDAPIKISS